MVQRNTMSFTRVSPTPQKAVLGEQVAQALRPHSDKMEAMMRRATGGPQYDVTSIEAQLTEALALLSDAARDA